jgi:copper homeostasis protein
MTKDKILIEIAAFTPEAALLAYQAGADRVELCSGYSEGGLSPAASAIQVIRDKIQIPLHVMIRPRVGDFVYTLLEKEIILAEVAFCRKTGADGVVVGALTADGTIDKPFLQEIMAAAGPLPVTFHRAFDLCINMEASLENLIDCGVARVLTSGGRQTAIEGMQAIHALVNSADNLIVILPGGGLSPGNIRAFVHQTGVTEVHLSAKRITYKEKDYNPDVILTTEGEVSDHCWYECDGEIIRAMQQSLAQ